MKGTVQEKIMKSGKTYLYIYLSYIDPVTGKYKQKAVSTHLEAKGNKRKVVNMIPDIIKKYEYLESEIPTELSRDISLCDYIDLWMKSKKRDVRQATYETYECRIRAIKRYFSKDDLPLRNITPAILNAFFKYSLHSGKTNQKTGDREPLSVRSVRSYRAILHSVFDEAVIDGLISVNPVTSVTVKGKKNKEYSEELLFLTEEEIQELLQFMADNYPHLVGITFMGAYYGLRRSEILGLKWSAVDWKHNCINIEHTVVRVETTIFEDNTKTRAGTRSLHLFDTAKACLKKIKKDQKQNAVLFGAGYKNTEGYIFTWADGRSYDPNYISRTFKKAMKKFGRPEITLHKLRHSCSSLLISKGWDIKQLQYWLGHADAETTLNIYTHYNRQLMKKQSKDLEEISSSIADIFDE